jgi:hypothetical protein
VNQTKKREKRKKEMKRRQQEKKPLVEKENRSLEYYMQNFKEVGEKCGNPLDVIKHRPKSKMHREVVAAVCSNKNYKDLGFRCDLYQVEIRFIEKFI